MEALINMDCTDPFNIQGSFSTYTSLLKECTQMKSLQEGHRTHTHIIIEGLDKNLVLANHLVGLYGKCGCVMEARHTFDRMADHNVFSWMAVLSAYANHGLSQELLALYSCMPGSVIPDKFIFATVLKACTSLIALDCGRNVHVHMMKMGTEMDVFVQTALINMYIRCGSIIDACHTFNETSERNVVLWNAMILGYVQQGYFKEAMELFEAMHRKGVIPDKVTFVGCLQVCACMGLLEEARQHHMDLVIFEYDADLVVSNTLIDTYARCRSFQDGRAVFASMVERDVVSYNVMIASYVQQGFSVMAINLYQKMKQDGVKPNETTFVSILKACTLLGDGERGKKFHRELLEEGCKLNAFVGSTLVDMYAKCGRLEDAYEVFCDMEEDWNVVVWTAMIAGYAQQGLGEESLDLYRKMEQNGVKPNEATIICALKACSILGAGEIGMEIHHNIKRSNMKADTLVMNSLVEMYTSCGSIKSAHLVFKEMPERDVASWTALIGGYAQQGLVQEALNLFEWMLHERVKPNAITFVSVLSACSHAGLIVAGCRYFYSMIWEHDIIPTPDHVACMVDLLGRAGHLEEAVSVILHMRVQQTELVWRTLLGACRTSINKGLANFAMKQILQLNPDNDAAYVLLSNIHNSSSSSFGLLEVDNQGMDSTWSELNIDTANLLVACES